MALFLDDVYDMPHDRIAFRKEIFRQQLNDENILLENEQHLMQHENSTLGSDDYSFEQEYDEDGLDHRDRMQYKNRLLCRQIHDLQREKQDILLENRKLVSANKRLTVKRSNCDLNRLLDEERLKNTLLERKNSKLTSVQRHDTCKRKASVKSKKASIAEGITQTVQDENIDLKLKVAGLNRQLIAQKRKYDRMHKEKTFFKNDSVTSPKKVIDNSSLKLKGRSRSTSPKRSTKTTRIENDSASNICFDDHQQECDDCKHLHTQNEELKHKTASIQREMVSYRAKSNGFEREMQKQKYQMQLNEDSISKHKRQNEVVQSKYERYLSSTQQELSSLRKTIREHEEHVKLLENENDKLKQDSKNDISELTRHFKKEKEHHYLEIERHKKALETAQQAQCDSQLNMAQLELRIKQTVGELQKANETIKSERSRNAVLSKERTQYNESSENLRILTEKLDSEREMYQRKFMKASSELENAAENNKLMERMCFDHTTSNQAIGETVHSLNTQIRELKMRKDREINNLNYECQRKDKAIKNTMTELSLIKEQNKTNAQLVTDLQIELGQYESNLKEKESDAAKMSITILNLRREVDTYQIELNEARDELRYVTDNNHEKSKQAFIDERYSLNDKVRELTNKLKRKDSDVGKMETKMAEFSLIEEKNIKLERQVTSLQIEVNQYKSALNDKSFAYTKLTDTISNLRREAEAYQSELSQARDELKNAIENTQQMERQFCDLKKSNQAFIDETDSLKKEIQELTNILKRKDSHVRKIDKKMAEFSSIEEMNNKLEGQVTELQIEVNRYETDLNDKSSASAKLTNTISNLRREVETYQSELNQARDELKNATENTKQMERQFSDLKKSDQAFIDEKGSLNDKIRDLTNTLKRKDIDVRKMEKKMAELSSIKEKNIELERQVADLQIEVNQYKSDWNCNKSASAKLTYTISNLRREVETYQSELDQARDELRNATENTQQMERQISDLKKSEQAFIDERGSLNDNVRQLTDILKGKDSDIRKIETKLADLLLIKEENVKAERQISDLRIKIQKYESELKVKSDNLTKLANTISDLGHESERCKSELKEAYEKIRKFDLQLKTVSDEHENCKHLISSLLKENEKLKSMSMYKVDQTGRSEATLSHREHELSLALEKSRRELREVQHELDDTKTRLSKVMGQKLTDNNPNIADLSDKNRPTKLAERYSELYDNQWTDAFEVICKQLHDEQSTIKSLIGILMNAAKYCREEARTQLEAIQGILLPRKTGSTFPSLVHKNLKDCRKALGEQTGAAIYEKYLQDIAKQRQQGLQLDVKPYVKECVELCWLMSIQDPPVVVAPELQHGGNFDTDFYKAYTKSGPLIDYVVWPALCLHEKGPLLCKGIAQGYGGKKTKY